MHPEALVSVSVAAFGNPFQGFHGNLSYTFVT